MQDISIAMKNIAYEEIYKKLEESNNYNIKMLDGSLIQMLYSFEYDKLVSHRLAFFPAPNLESFQNEPENYENDEIYADILGKNIVTFPIRFDYAYSVSKLPPIPDECCHSFHFKAATDSG